MVRSDDVQVRVVGWVWTSSPFTPTAHISGYISATTRPAGFLESSVRVSVRAEFPARF
jgi:hypothetical protein